MTGRRRRRVGVGAVPMAPQHVQHGILESLARQGRLLLQKLLELLNLSLFIEVLVLQDWEALCEDLLRNHAGPQAVDDGMINAGRGTRGLRLTTNGRDEIEETGLGRYQR